MASATFCILHQLLCRWISVEALPDTHYYVTSVSQLVSVCAYAQRYHDIGINLRINFNVHIGINLYYIMFNCGCMHLLQKIDVPQIVD